MLKWLEWPAVTTFAQARKGEEVALRCLDFIIQATIMYLIWEQLPVKRRWLFATGNQTDLGTYIREVKINTFLFLFTS